MLIALAVIVCIAGRFVNMYVERMYYDLATAERAEMEELLASGVTEGEYGERLVVRSVPYDATLNWRKLFGFGYGSRSWILYVSDVIVLLSVYVLSSMSGWDVVFGIGLAVLMYMTWVTDVREGYIYNRFTYPAIVLFLVYAIGFGHYVWWLHVAGGVAMFVTLVGISFFMRGKMGDGDVKVLVALGFYFGYADIIPVLLSASVIGLVYGSVLKRKRQASTAYPFGPFIVAGVYIVWVSGISLLNL